MKKGANGERKIPISISLTEKTLKNLEEFCKQNYNAERSTVIEQAIKKFLEDKK